MSNSAVTFIRVALCDNDFAQPLEEAVTRVFQDLGAEYPAEEFKACVIDLVLSLHKIRDTFWKSSFDRDHLKSYLEKMEVIYLYSNNTDMPDHDGGSVAVDVNRKYIWRY